MVDRDQDAARVALAVAHHELAGAHFDDIHIGNLPLIRRPARSTSPSSRERRLGVSRTKVVC
jgi:hypothetical protein